MLEQLHYARVVDEQQDPPRVGGERVVLGVAVVLVLAAGPEGLA